MIKLLNFQEVIGTIDDSISMEDVKALNFETIELGHSMCIVGMSEKEHEGQKYAVPEFQPLNPFSSDFKNPVTLNSKGILYCHEGNPSIREYYDYVVSEITGGIVKPPEKDIIMPH